VSAEAGEDGRVIPAEEAGDVGEAVAAFGVVAKQPPELVAGARDALEAGASAEVVEGDAAAGADLSGELQEVTLVERFGDGVVPEGRAAHDALRLADAGGEGGRRWRQESASMSRTWQCWAKRSTRATTQAAPGNTVFHCLKGRFVVTTVDLLSWRREMMLYKRSAERLSHGR
jgi:hypothetical protein